VSALTDHSPPDEPASLLGARWIPLVVGEERVQELARATGLSRAAARVLALRWTDPSSDPSEWLDAGLDHLCDPYAMLNMEAAVDRLRFAVRRGERLKVVTDYDVDGTTSSLVLQAALKLLSGQVRVDYHIPNRFGEGYGFSVHAARQAASEGVGLVVTADIGVRDHAAVAAAREAGVDVLVCDHHLPAGASVPQGATVLCPPQQGDSYPNRALAACGVSLKLAQALLAEHPKRDAIVRSLLKLAAIGTVADMVPLDTIENRAIVRMGLRELNRGPHHAGLTALMRAAGLTPGAIKTNDLGYRLGPRINAAGRVADATLVVELLSTRDEAEATELARTLEALNTERKDIQRRLVDEALEAIGDDPDPFVVLSGREDDGWHRGVVGIVAARVKEEVHRPVAVVSIQGELAVGSVRSVPGVHAVQALDSASDLLVKYGGHPAAAGFTVPTAHLDALRARLGDFVRARLSSSDLVPIRKIDARLEPAEVREALLAELKRLGPFGIANPRPTFLLQGVQAHGVRVLGKDQRTLKFLVPTGAGRRVEAIWWGRAELADLVRTEPLDLLVTLDENVWQGTRRLQLEVRDARVSVL
jgi:single-stranded-DNA-specific exonuclease